MARKTHIPHDDIARKSDVNRLEGKLDSSVKRLSIEIVRTHARIDKLEESIDATFQSHTSRILSHIDAFAGKLPFASASGNMIL